MSPFVFLLTLRVNYGISIRLSHPALCVLVEGARLHWDLMHEMLCECVLLSVLLHPVEEFKFVFLLTLGISVAFSHISFLALYPHILDPVLVSLTPSPLLLQFRPRLTKVLLRHVYILFIILFKFEALHILTAISVVTLRILILSGLIRVIVRLARA